MKRYGQACAIARSLDVIGERWNLLLVRELSLGPLRHRDLAAGVPGIPSNVLAARLKDLQAAGVVAKRTLPAPADVTVYELTDAGRALQPALKELFDWGWSYAPAPDPDDAVQPGWALLSVAGRRSPLPEGRTCELRIGPDAFHLGSEAGKVTVSRGSAPSADVVVAVSADTFYGLMAGQVPVAGALERAEVEGEAGIARHVLDMLVATGPAEPAPAL